MDWDGGVELEKEAGMACGYPEESSSPSRGSAKQQCPGVTETPVQSLASCWFRQGSILGSKKQRNLQRKLWSQAP